MTSSSFTNDTTVLPQKANVKGTTENKDPMQRSHDTWVLLLVVSVLSTLLTVIFLIICVWICVKFCIHPSVFRTPVFGGDKNYKPDFPPQQRREVELEEIRAGIHSLLEQRSAMNFASNKTGASQNLGYKSNRNAAVPVLPPPRSWTPSPPFIPGKHHLPPPCLLCEEHLWRCSASHHRGCHPSLDNWTRGKRPEKQIHGSLYLTNLKGKPEAAMQCAEEPICAVKNNNSEGVNSGYKPPHNTPDSDHLRGSRRKMRVDDCTYESFVEHLKNPRVGGGYPNSRLRDDFSLSGNAIKSPPLAPRKDTFLGHDVSCLSKGVCSHDGCSSNSFKRSTPQGKMARMSNGDFPIEQDGRKTTINPENRNCLEGEDELEDQMKKKKRRKEIITRKARSRPPVSVFLESPSSESSLNLSFAVDRSGKTYWKIYHHEDRNEHTEDVGPSDPTPSMSWDHLTPDPSPVNDFRPQIHLDPLNAKITYYPRPRSNGVNGREVDEQGATTEFPPPPPTIEP